MKATAVHEHLKSLGPWVDWENTSDVFLHGNPHIEVRAIACMWIPTKPALREAAERGANLVISHEPAFYPGYTGKWRAHPYPEAVETAEAKRAFIDGLGLTILRSHDVWDFVPEHGVVDSWARFLGFPLIRGEERLVRRDLAGSGHDDEEIAMALRFHRLMDVSGHTVGSLAGAILERVRETGQEWILVSGDGSRPVSRLAVGTGAATKFPLMRALGGDVLLGTDDGVNTWDGALWAQDADIPLLLVNHAASEIPGMMSMAEYLSALYPEVPTFHVPVGIPYRTHS